MGLLPTNLVGVHGIHLDSLVRGGKLTPFLTILHVIEVKTPSVHIVVSCLRAMLSTCVRRIQYIGPNGPFEHHLEGLRFRFSFMVTWPSTAFASGL